MLAKEDNELITNTNPGTPMGELFRRFWLPVALSEELPGPDCVAGARPRPGRRPHRLPRHATASVGLVDAYCPHRGAPMFFGRNEEDGLRCVYHGWKFDVDGDCVDLPNAPEGDTYKNKVDIISLPLRGQGRPDLGLHGPGGEAASLPRVRVDQAAAEPPLRHQVPSSSATTCRPWRATTTRRHARFLHSTLDANAEQPRSQRPRRSMTAGSQIDGDIDADEPFPRAVGNRRVTDQADQRSQPRRRARSTTSRRCSASRSRRRPDGKVRPASARPGGCRSSAPPASPCPATSRSNMRIPIDNESLMFYRLRWSWEPISDDELAEYKNGGYSHPELIPGTWMPQGQPAERLQDRPRGSEELHLHGIKTFPLQDIALIETQWGPIAKREYEHLVSADYMIIHVRRRLLKAAKDMQPGIEPEGRCTPRSSASTASRPSATRRKRRSRTRSRSAWRLSCR